MTLNKLDDGIYINDTITNSIKDVDSIIFDCDGVLIDIRKSYDLAIKQTTSFILNDLEKITNSTPITPKIIDGFKNTGGFNDEVDITYASIISLIAAKRLDKNGEEFIFQVIQNADKTGIISVEKYLGTLVDISDIQEKIAYPGERTKNYLNSIFDQIFYGPKLYPKLFGKESQFTETGLIENDVVLVDSNLIDILKKKFQTNIAIVSGRGIESIRYSLKELLNEFNTKNSAFLEDESRDMAKPNPQPLIRSMNGMHSSCCLFVGDSMEDFIMAQEATKMGNRAIFCAVIGTSKNPQQKMQFFEDKGVCIILDSIKLLPKVLNLV